MGGFRRAGLLAAVHAGPATLAGAMKLITSVDEANVVPTARTYELSGRVRNLLADIDLEAGLTATIYDPAVDDERAREIAEQLHVLKTRDEERLAQAQAQADADAAAAAAVSQHEDDGNEPAVKQSKTEQRRLQRNARARELRRQRRAARPGAQPAGSASRRRVLALPDESDDEPVTAASPRYIESDEDNCGAPASFVGDVDCASSSGDSDDYDDDSDSGAAAAPARHFVVDLEAADDDHVFALHQAAILPQDDDDDVSLDAHHWAPGDQAPDLARLTEDGYFD